jgi:hypothetical protein
MSRSLSRSRLLAVAALAVLAAALAATVLATTGSAARNVSAVKVVKNPKLGRQVLVTRRGFTLYSLSVEGRSLHLHRQDLPVVLTPLVVPWREADGWRSWPSGVPTTPGHVSQPAAVPFSGDRFPATRTATASKTSPGASPR